MPAALSVSTLLHGKLLSTLLDVLTPVQVLAGALHHRRHFVIEKKALI